MAKIDLTINAKDNASGKISGIGKAIVGAMSATKLLAIGMKAVKESIELASKNSASFAAEQKKLQQTASALANTFGKVLGDSLAGVLKSFNEFINKKEGMETISKIITGIGTGMKIFSSLIKAAITNVGNLISIMVSAAETAANFFKYLAGKATWDEVSASAKKTGDSVKKMTSDYVDGVKSVVSTTVTEIKNFGENSKKTQQELSAQLRKAKIEEIKKQKELQEKAAKEYVESVTKMENERIKKTKEGVEKQKKRFEEEQKNIKDHIKKVASELLSLGQTIGTAITTVMGEVGNLVNGIFEDMLNKQDAALSKELELIDSQTQEKLRYYGLQEKTRQEQLTSELDALRAQLDEAETDEDKKRIQDEIKTKENELKKEQIVKQAEEEKTAAQKAAAKKRAEIEKQQFESSKAMKIAEIWINAAAAIMGTWAGYASMGIPGAIAAGVQTGVVLTIAGIQTGVIASQQYSPPAFAEGGIVPGNSYSGDRVMAAVNSGEMVINREQQGRLFNAIERGGIGGGIIYNNIYLDGTLIKRQMINMREFERFAY
jgi:hypothetical protein